MATTATATSTDRASKRGHAAKARRGDRRRYRRHSRIDTIATHAALIVATCIAVLPVLWILLSSFKPAALIKSSEIKLIDQPTLDNYRAVLTGTDFPRWMLNSLLVATATTTIGVLMAATAAYAISRFRFPGRRPLLWLFLITQMFPIVILIAPIYTIFAALGLINTLTSLVLAYCMVAVPFCTWMLKSYFDSIPFELDEAAALDGLSPFGTFWRIVVPLARPGIAVAAFFTFITAWGEVAYATAFIQTDDRFTLGYGLQKFVPQFNQQWEYLTPAAVLITIPAAIVFFFAQRHLVAGLSAGATKG